MRKTIIGLLAIAIIVVASGLPAWATDPDLVTVHWYFTSPTTLQTPQFREDDAIHTGPVIEVDQINPTSLGYPDPLREALYTFKIAEFQTDHWVVVYTSPNHETHNVSEHECFTSMINNGYAYYVKFYRTSGFGQPPTNQATIDMTAHGIGHDHGDCAGVFL